MYPNPINPLNYFSRKASTLNVEITDEKLENPNEIIIGIETYSTITNPFRQLDWNRSNPEYKLSDFPINEQKHIIQLIKAMRAEYHNNIGKVDIISFPYESHRLYLYIKIDNVIIAMGNEYFRVNNDCREGYHYYQRIIKPEEVKLRTALVEYGMNMMKLDKQRDYYRYDQRVKIRERFF